MREAQRPTRLASEQAVVGATATLAVGVATATAGLVAKIEAVTAAGPDCSAGNADHGKKSDVEDEIAE